MKSGLKKIIPSFLEAGSICAFNLIKNDTIPLWGLMALLLRNRTDLVIYLVDKTVGLRTVRCRECHFFSIGLSLFTSKVVANQIPL